VSGPLAGLKVLDLSRLLPGGFCSLLLSDLGADVLKIEDTGTGDYVRWAPPHYEGADPSAGSALFLALNRGKRSIRINLKTNAGRDVLLRLVRDADVLLESFRPGVLDRLGVGHDRLREENPRLVSCAITGYGQTGPYRDRSGHDLNYLGLVGLLALTGEPDGPPVSSAGQIADIGGGALMAAFGILAALRERDRSGLGQFVDVSMADGALSWAGDGRRPGAGRGARPAPGRARAGRAVDLLPPVPLRGRLGHAGRPRAEVLAGVVPGRGPGGPSSSVSWKHPARQRTARSKPSSRRARAPSGPPSPRIATAAWNPCSTSTRCSSQSSCGRGRWSSSSGSRASSGPCASSACR
jgi:hypothetical protein